VGAEVRFLVMGTFLGLCVISGVFLPTFSRQVFDGVLVSAIFVVLLAWLVHYLVTHRGLRPARTRLRRAQVEAGGSLNVEGGEHHE